MKTIEFYGDTLEVVDMNGQPGVTARRLVENLGLSWGRQAEKLMDPMFRCAHMCTPSAGGSQETLILPVKSLPAYLFSIGTQVTRRLNRAATDAEGYSERFSESITNLLGK